MSYPTIELSHFDKKIRGKIRLAIFMNKLLHIIYLATKNFRNQPELLKKYKSIKQLVTDKQFVMRILARESRSNIKTDDILTYEKILKIMLERGYENLLDIADIVWDLTVHQKKIHQDVLFRNILGIPVQPFYSTEMMELRGKISYSKNPFMLKIRGFNYTIIEAEYGRSRDKLAKTLIYIGSLPNTNKSLGFFARFSLRSLDAEYMISNQSNGSIHRFAKTFRFFPTLLRLQRLSYKKVISKKELDEELINMLSEIYHDTNQLSRIINMDVNANIMAMAPSISLNGGLCYTTAFRGELLSVLGSGKEAKIKVDDMIIRAYPSFHSVLQYDYYPGEYVFMVFHPFTITRVGIIIATFPLEILDKIKPKKRNVSSLDNLFPKLIDVVKTYR